MLFYSRFLCSSLPGVPPAEIGFDFLGFFLHKWVFILWGSVLVRERILGCAKGGEVPVGWAELPFGEAVGSWVGVFREALGERVPEVVSEGVMRALEGELVARLSELCAPAFVLEMHIVKLGEGLQGASSEERYSDYVHRFLGDEGYLRGVFAEYGVMCEWIETAVDLWVNKVVEFFERVEGDYGQLRERFGVEGGVREIRIGLADPHNGNRSVYELIFENGVSVFYKPKSLGIDEVFNDFLRELNGWGLPLGLKVYETWNRGNYGWAEKIEHVGCKDEREVREYYTRSGMLLCLFYLFGGTDVHHENLIAAGAHPVVIDLESLFHPQLSSQQVLDDPKAWKQSVLHVGMLPHFMLGEAGLQGVDISGLGGNDALKVPTLVPKWDALNSDEMHLVYVQPLMKKEKNTVWVGEKECVAKDYVEEIVAGFKTLYALMQEKKGLLLGSGGWLERFAYLPVRCICRPTRLYFKLLQQLLDPAHLRERAGHKEILDILPRYLLENGNVHLQPVVNEELRAMQQRDIPFFQALPSSRDLYLNGEVIIENVLEEPTIEAARELLEGMCAERCLEQVDFIVQSFYALEYSKEGSITREMSAQPLASLHALSDEELLEEALRLGRSLLERGRRDQKGGLRWIGIEFLAAEEQAVLAPLSRNLYGGVLGVALFFAALYKVTRAPLWKGAAEASLKQFVDSLDGEGTERLPGALGLGGMSGVGSLIYTLGHVATCIDEPKYLEKAHFITTLIHDKHIYGDTFYDVISGCAGLILALVSLHTKVKEGALLGLAQRAGEHLVKSAQNEETGMSWRCEGERGLLGFSHGVAGIAFALEKLAVATQNEMYFEVADRALDYERAHFSKKAQNWRDFRAGAGDFSLFAWCHGAPGIGLGRACSPRFSTDPQMQEEVKQALVGTMQSFHHHSHHLCCGTLGNAEILSVIGRKTEEAALIAYAREQVSVVVLQARREGGYCLGSLLPRSVFSPGFMQGLSGIGYALLRHTKKGCVLPNVLVLE